MVCIESHIDRKLFKLREMRGAGMVEVKYVATDENTADVFTKILDRVPFTKLRKLVMNLLVRSVTAVVPRANRRKS